jgi:hypothetical protein
LAIFRKSEYLKLSSTHFFLLEKFQMSQFWMTFVSTDTKCVAALLELFVPPLYGVLSGALR